LKAFAGFAELERMNAVSELWGLLFPRGGGEGVKDAT